MSFHLDIRVNGVTKMADQIEEIPSFMFDGKELVIRATLVNEPEVPDVPRMNYDQIQAQLADEDQDQPGNQTAGAGTPQARKGGRKPVAPQGDDVPNEVEAAEREADTREESAGGSDDQS